MLPWLDEVFAISDTHMTLNYQGQGKCHDSSGEASDTFRDTSEIELNMTIIVLQQFKSCPTKHRLVPKYSFKKL